MKKIRIIYIFFHKIHKMNALDIKKIRKSMGMSQTDFGQILGVGIRSIQLWESGSRDISESAKKLLIATINEEKSIPDTIEDLLIKKVEKNFKGEIDELKEMIQSLKVDIQLINLNSMHQRNVAAKKENGKKKLLYQTFFEV